MILQEHVFSREHIAQVKSLLENGGINCLTDQQSFDKSPSVTPTPSQSTSQTVAATASIIGGLYNQYLLQQNNTQQLQQSVALNSNGGSGGGGNSNIVTHIATINPNENLLNHQNFHQSQDQDQKTTKQEQQQQSLMENNLLLQINADKQSTSPSTTNSEILQQLYNYSQMSGELIK